MHWKRRKFIKRSLAAAGATLAYPLSTWSAALGANGDVRIGVVGLGNQGPNHVNWFRSQDGVRVVALCDPDQTRLDKEARKFADRKEKVATYRDMRQMFESKDVDAVIIAAPNHWHALAGVWAMQAGKDVYVEKPVSHNVWEGRQLVKAARKHDRIVQSGMQRRSDAGLAEALAWLGEGHLGKITLARGIVYVNRGSIGRTQGPQPIPETLDYDLWCGPAPKAELRRRRLHYDWHWFWQTGDGDFGNNGIHFIDICRWAIGATTLAPRVISLGGRLGYDDDGETPNTQVVFHDYQPAPILFEVRGLPAKKGMDAMDQYKGTRAATVVHCEGGWFVGGFAYDKDGKRVKEFKRDGGGARHHANFIKAVRSRKRDDLNAEILDGHLSAALCHTGNISYRLGRPARPEIVRDALAAEPALGETLERLLKHLAANEVNLAQTPLALGRHLELDPQTERFTGPHVYDANRLLTRQHRAPYTFPRI